MRLENKSRVFRLDTNGEIELVAEFSKGESKFLKKSMLVAYLELKLNNNSNTWEYEDSKFHLEINETPLGNYQYVDADGTVYYVR